MVVAYSLRKMLLSLKKAIHLEREKEDEKSELFSDFSGIH